MGKTDIPVGYRKFPDVQRINHTRKNAAAQCKSVIGLVCMVGKLLKLAVDSCQFRVYAYVILFGMICWRFYLRSDKFLLCVVGFFLFLSGLWGLSDMVSAA